MSKPSSLPRLCVGGNTQNGFDVGQPFECTTAGLDLSDINILMTFDSFF